MKNLYIILFLIISGSLYSQNNLENANWIFGNLSWLDFNNSSLISHPTPAYGTSVTSITPNPVYLNVEGCASISDEDGNLLFFTDGKRVYRIISNHIEVIEYASAADNLRGDNSSAQNTVIIPRPNWDGRYYLVSIVGFTSSSRGLYWSEFDANTNHFISKNNVLADGINIFNPAFNNLSEAITTCVADNGVDMWLITHIKSDTNAYSKILSYRVTSSGIASNPSGSFIFPLPDDQSPYSIRVSPDTTRIALSMLFANPFIGTFNNNTGAITIDPLQVGNVLLADSVQTYSAEFSPDSDILYFSRIPDQANVQQGIFAVALNNPTVESLVIGSISTTLQRGLNDRLYAAMISQNTILEIANPNSFGTWVTNTINLGTGISYLGLPQWIWPTCKNTLTLTNPENNISGTNSRRERSQWIKASNTIQASAATNVIYHAGNFVELRPGFEGKFGARVSAYIEGCSNTYAYRSGTGNETPTTDDSAKLMGKFLVSPNPSNSFIDLTLQNDSFDKIVIASIDGKIILDQSLEATGSYHLDISSYASGIYIINVVAGNGKRYSQKLIKN